MSIILCKLATELRFPRTTQPIDYEAPLSNYLILRYWLNQVYPKVFQQVFSSGEYRADRLRNIKVVIWRHGGYHCRS